MVKFADDFIITASSKALLEEEVKPLVEQFLAERGLTLSPEKTVITHIDDGFDFLYHRHVCSKQTFSKIDAAIFQALWRWAKRRHPLKSSRWVKQKYFPALGSRQWVFSGQVNDQQGQKITIRLFYAQQVPIRRHIKIKADANPYDPSWEPYFEKRLNFKIRDELKGKPQLLHLWHRQQGRCPVCQQLITKQTGWHNHHIVWRVNGAALII